MQHTFFVHFFAVVLHDHNVKLPMSYVFLSPFFSRCSVSRWWPQAFPIFFASLACRRTFSFSLSFSFFLFVVYSKFVDMTLNLDNTDTGTFSAFRFRLYWLLSGLCFTRRGWPYTLSSQNNLTFDIGLHIVGVRAFGRTLRHNHIFLLPWVSNLSFTVKPRRGWSFCSPWAILSACNRKHESN